jgi:hypothetical protein
VEEPDIVPSRRGLRWLPSFGAGLETALVQFSIRTLLRSRQHRVILSFYWGMGFAVAIFYLKSPLAQRQFAELGSGDLWHTVSGPLLAASVVVLSFCVLGTRIVFSLPLEVGANWVFRIMPVDRSLPAHRRAMYLLGVAPAWLASAAVFLTLWPTRAALAHLLVLALTGALLSELCLYGIPKIPFTCSWLPGKSKVHLVFWLCIGHLVALLDRCIRTEREALDNATSYAMLTGSLLALTVTARVLATARAKQESVQYEDNPEPAIFALQLRRDGAPIA